MMLIVLAERRGIMKMLEMREVFIQLVKLILVPARRKVPMGAGTIDSLKMVPWRRGEA